MADKKLPTVKPLHPPALSARRVLAAFEITLIVLLFFVLAGTPAPDVNEAHYLAKAKHYWNPQWCSGDLFLESADAHWMFYWIFGWLTRFASLTTVAWVGRFLTWAFFAWGWQRLSSAIVPGKLVAVLSAALFATLIRWGHMAGEWIIGGVEAKGFAYVLVLFALESLVRERWRRAILLCGTAAALHVLVGGWSLVALGIAWLLTDRLRRPALRTLWPAMALAVALAMPGLIPGLALNWSTDAATIREANRIYVFERLSHHLVFHELPYSFIARHAMLIAIFALAWKWLGQRHGNAAFSGPLPRFVVGTMLIAVLGAILDQSLLFFRPAAAALLRYYWFRLSDVMAPFGVTFALIVLQQRAAFIRPGVAAWMLLALLLVVTADVSSVFIQHQLDPRPGAVAQAFPAVDLSGAERVHRWDEWRKMCDWVAENTRPADLFLTPRNQQTFKWDANRAEVVSGKDFPQDAAGIVAWRRRMDDIFPFTVRFADLVAHGQPRLVELSQKYGFRYIVVDRGISSGMLTFPRVYPESKDARGVYEVYWVNRDSELSTR